MSIQLASANGESRDPEPSDSLGNLFERLSDLVSVTTSLDSYLSVDQDLPVAEENTLSEIAAAVRERDSKEASDDEDTEENEIDNNSVEATASIEAAAVSRTLKSLH